MGGQVRRGLRERPRGSLTLGGQVGNEMRAWRGGAPGGRPSRGAPRDRPQLRHVGVASFIRAIVGVGGGGARRHGQKACCPRRWATSLALTKVGALRRREGLTGRPGEDPHVPPRRAFDPGAASPPSDQDRPGRTPERGRPPPRSPSHLGLRGQMHGSPRPWATPAPRQRGPCPGAPCRVQAVYDAPGAGRSRPRHPDTPGREVGPCLRLPSAVPQQTGETRPDPLDGAHARVQVLDDLDCGVPGRRQTQPSTVGPGDETTLPHVAPRRRPPAAPPAARLRRSAFAARRLMSASRRSAPCRTTASIHAGTSASLCRSRSLAGLGEGVVVMRWPPRARCRWRWRIGPSGTPVGLYPVPERVRQCVPHSVGRGTCPAPQWRFAKVSC